MRGEAMSEPTAANTTPLKRRRFRVLRILGLFAIVLVLLLVAAPWIVAHTGLRDEAINEIVSSPTVTASSGSASFSWFSPLSVHGLHLKSANNHVDLRVDDLIAEKPPYQLWSSAPDLGTITVEKPHVTLELPLDVNIERHKRTGLEPTFTAILKDAGLTVRLAGLDEPVLDVDGINMTVRVEKADEGRVLTLDPVVIFDHRKLSPKLASNLLHLFDATMSDTPDVNGEFSLSLDKLRIPIGIPREEAIKRVELEGKLVLHQVSKQVKNPMSQTVVQLVADLNGKKASEVVRLAQDAEIHFQVRDGRLYHEGLRVGFPDIDPQLQLTSHGSVGLDRTVDLFLELPRLDPAQRKQKGPAKCHITGTITNPKISVEDGSFVLRQPDRKEPILAANGINLNMEVENTAKGRVLVVEPFEVCKKRKLDLEVAAGLVRFLAPDFQHDREVTGEVSLSVSKLRMPLVFDEKEAIKQLEVEGNLTLHQVGSQINSSMWQALIKMVADMNGKRPGKVIRVEVDADIPFQVHDGRLYHEGLRVGFPDIDPRLVVSTRGSIGLDETLNLFADLPRLDQAEQKAKGPAKCQITGTIANPKIAVENGSLVLRDHDRKEPIIAVHSINLNMEVENTPKGRVLVVQPVEVFKKTELNLGVANNLMKYISPDVHSDREVTGEISLSLSKVRVPLGLTAEEEAKQLEAEGKLTLHQVSSELKSPMWQGLIKMLADLRGKQPSKMIHIIEESEIRFQVKDGRLHHDVQRVGFPEIDPELVISTRGSVGLDETLDLVVEMPRLRKEKLDKGPLQCQVTGTIKEPKIAIKDAPLVIKLNGGDKAALTVDNLNLNFSIEDSKDGRTLTLAPVTLFEKQKLTPEVADQFIHLIVPALLDLTGVEGEVSLSLDKFRVPLGIPESELERKVELAGKLQLYQITLSTKTPLLQTMVKMVADEYGKKPSVVVRVVKNADVKFNLKDGQMYHEGLQFGFPDISPDLIAKSSGSVGLDKSLDIVLEVPGFLVDKKDIDIKKAPPVRFRVTGTIDKPVVTQIKDGKDK
jgi:hypothetical protein